MNYTEQALQFTCQNETLIGIASLPEHASKTGVVIVVGGPQYRIGAHRHFVLLARALAAAGYPCLRFDYRGMGDSSGSPRNFEDINADIEAAIEALKAVTAIDQVVLWGLCDAASAALLYAKQMAPPNLAGLCLLNPWVRSEASLAQTQLKHYYRQRILQASFWQGLLKGGVIRKALRGLRDNFKHASSRTTNASSFIQQMACAWRDYPGNILVIIAANDMTGLEFETTRNASPDWQAAPTGKRETVKIAKADHTFSSQQWRDEVESATLNWLAHLPPN